MYWHIDTDIISLIILCLLYWFNIRMVKETERSEQNKRFLWCLRSGILMTVVDIASSVVMMVPTPHALYQIAMMLYLIMLLLVIVSWLYYVLSILYSHDDAKRKRVTAIIFGVHIAYSALVLTNPWTGLFFTLTEGANMPLLDYTRGVLFLPVTLGLYAAYLILLTVLVIQRRRFIDKGYPWIVLLITPIVLSISIPVQLLIPGWLMLLPAYMLCMTIAFLNFQNLRVRGERAQLHSLAELVDHFACGVSISRLSADNQITIIHFSAEYCALFEESSSSLIDKHSQDLCYGVHPDDRETFRQMLDTITRRENSAVTYRFVTVTGNVKWIHMQTEIVPQKDGSALCYSTYNDLTKLYQAQRHLTDVIQTVPCGICLYRWDGRTLTPLMANTQLSEMLGRDALEHLKRIESLNYEYVHPDDADALRAAVLNALRTYQDVDFTFRMYNSVKQQYMWLRQRGTIVVQPDGTQLAYVTYNDVTQEHAAQQQLMESERMLEYATDQAGLRYWRYDTQKDRLVPDARYQREHDLPPVIDNFMTQWLDEHIAHPDALAVFRDACERLRDGEKRIVFEVQNYAADQAPHWHRFCVSNLLDKDGKPGVAVGISMQIDGEKELRARYELEKKRASKNDHSILAYALLNLTTGELVERGGTMDDMIMPGIEPSGAPPLIDPDEREALGRMTDRDELLRRFAQGETELTLEYRRRIPPAEVRWVRCTMHLVRDPQTSNIMLFETLFDIEDEKMLELIYKFIATEAYDYVARIDGNTKRFTVLPKPGVIYGTPPTNGANADVYARDQYAAFVFPEDRDTVVHNMLVDTIRQRLADAERFQYIYRELQADGTVRYKKMTKAYIDARRAIIIVLREDVTELIYKETEKNNLLAAALDAAKQASVAKSQFLSRVSHELRTPLNAIIGFMELARGASDEQVQLCLSHSDVAARQLLAIINDVLDVSSIESGKMKIAYAPFSLKQLIQSINNLFTSQCHQKGLTFEATISPDLNEWFIGDRLRVNQILINLLSNAVKFTHKGRIGLTVRQLETRDDKVLTRFEVSDTGCGMSGEMLERLFKPFEQASAATAQKYGGNGLGLSIVSSLVQLMHGVIHVSSAPDKGTTFTVDLPFSKSDADTGLQNLDDTKVIRVLAADDEPAEREYLSSVLERVGVRFTVVSGGSEALDALERAQSDGDPYNICLVDWVMPGMSGIETARRVRDKYGNGVILIITSACEHDQINENIKAAGANMFITKPLFQSSLFDLFATLTGGRIARKPAETPDYDFSGCRILLAEDNHLNRIVAEGLLTQKFHTQCDCAADGKIALDLFLASAPGTYDAILMDIQMPNMNGYEAALAIRASSHPEALSIPIIALTANAFNEDIVKSLSNGMNAHVAKPIDPGALAAALRGALRTAGA